MNFVVFQKTLFAGWGLPYLLGAAFLSQTVGMLVAPFAIVIMMLVADQLTSVTTLPGMVWVNSLGFDNQVQQPSVLLCERAAGKVILGCFVRRPKQKRTEEI